MPSSHVVRACCVLLFALACLAKAQCEPTWASASPQPQLSGSVFCSALWDPDAAGPLPQRIVVGGISVSGGSLPAGSKVGTWDGTRWLGLAAGPGTSGVVQAFAVWNGSLVAAGDFTGGGISRLALWDGSAWQPFANPFTGSINVLTVWNGNLVAAGTSSGSPGLFIRSWNGAAWSTIPSPPTLDSATAMVVFQGLLCVGGLRVTPAAGVLERWNGTSWASSILATGGLGTTPVIRCLAVRTPLAIGATPTLYAGGNFSTIGGATATAIAVTSGGAGFTWSSVGGNTSPRCWSLVVTNAGLGSVVTATFDGSTQRYASRYTSASGAWTTIGVDAYDMLLYGGSYYGAVSSGAGSWQRHDGTAWVPVLGPGLQGDVRAIAPSGPDVIVGGTIQSVSGAPLNGIARWNGATFEPLGTGVTGTSVDAVLKRSNGDIVAGGSFSAAGGGSASNVARWNGSAWAAFGTGTNQPVLSLCEMPNGDLIAGGKFTLAGGITCNRIARWNGSAWSSMNFGFNGDVSAVAVRGDGTLFAAGAFTQAGATACNRIARWDGFGWQPLGTGTNGDVLALAFRPNGDLVAVGAFTNAGGVAVDRCAIWNGATWTSTGSSSGDPTPVRSVCVLPNGDVVAGRGFHQPAAAIDAGLARWNGTNWSGLQNGVVSATSNTVVEVRALAQRGDGVLFVGGNFGFANGTTANGGLVARGLAELRPTCFATASNIGAGCNSSVGTLTLTADTLPWLGSTLRTTTTAVAPGSLCVSVIGLTQLSIPLPSLLPEGQPGCSLLSAPDIVLLAANGPGNTASQAFALANDPVLLGVPFAQQTLPLEFDAQGTIVAIRGSNALGFVIGTL